MALVIKEIPRWRHVCIKELYAYSMWKTWNYVDTSRGRGRASMDTFKQNGWTGYFKEFPKFLTSHRNFHTFTVIYLEMAREILRDNFRMRRHEWFVNFNSISQFFTTSGGKNRSFLTERGRATKSGNDPSKCKLISLNLEFFAEF